MPEESFRHRSQTVESFESREPLEFRVPPGQAGMRLDLFVSAAALHLGISRAMVQQLIRKGDILVDGRLCKGGHRVQNSERVTVRIPPVEPSLLIPEEISFQILHEDDDLLVISKPPGLVVHPASGNQTGTLVHGLLFHSMPLSGGGGAQRPGIVHRLDKDTSGAMVIAKHDSAHLSLAKQFKNRQVEKTYHALVRGELSGQGRISRPIGRHPVHRKKMAALESGREAVTNWRVCEHFRGFTLLEARPETGRTHQIRVHLAAIGHVIAGDSTYGRPQGGEAALGITRHFLHASRLAFFHPASGVKVQFTAPLWPDLEKVLLILREQRDTE